MYETQDQLWEDISDSIDNYITYFNETPDKIFITRRIVNSLFENPENAWVASLPVEFNTDYTSEDYFLSNEDRDKILLSSDEIIGLE